MFKPLSQFLDGRELIALPTAELHHIPWGALPSLRGVPITVAPSATAWMRAERSARSAGHFVSVVTASGTFLHVLRDGVRLVGEDATPSAVLSALNGASVAHLSVPVSEGQGNSWFSAAELPTGPLFASAIRDLPAPPGIVVLDSHQQPFNGFPVGSDMFGFAGALLNAGVRTVVTTVGPENDMVAVAAVEALYRNLSAGRSVAQALANVTAQDPYRAPFVCLGADSTMTLR